MLLQIPALVGLLALEGACLAAIHRRGETQVRDALACWRVVPRGLTMGACGLAGSGVAAPALAPRPGPLRVLRQDPGPVSRAYTRCMLAHSRHSRAPALPQASERGGDCDGANRALSLLASVLFLGTPYFLCRWVLHCERVMGAWASTLLAEEAERARHDGRAWLRAARSALARSGAAD